jgi:hypothetical protein
VHAAVMKTEYQPSPALFRTDMPQIGDVVFHGEFGAHCSQIWGHPEILCQMRIHGDSATGQNIKSINAWVMDEWKTMQLVYQIMRQKGFGSFTREQKMKLLFAARSHVKIKMVRDRDPGYAQQISSRARSETGELQWLLGGGIVAVRDALFPKGDQATERLKNSK